ncbi:helicase, putative [Trypanosoma brucei gambiense DAL972]|uniref:Helicase, putative n=1 Tax=Trypanosoma brucei gambiense (strain MHOM/CI/86/DAL972) TaxID=679716 RepID=C9ZZD1_TRYB9|nr:helicase, putative [Trypanosoma brucei gambiense DAL972]CBH14780.1 helicase, putative [Trypanosoma brucei gambiense DAL972]|eukprot:XP_011777046.1 helicase, putative [Trypanosoma brucei gambiense DAL972]
MRKDEYRNRQQGSFPLSNPYSRQGRGMSGNQHVSLTVRKDNYTDDGDIRGGAYSSTVGDNRRLQHHRSDVDPYLHHDTQHTRDKRGWCDEQRSTKSRPCDYPQMVKSSEGAIRRSSSQQRWITQQQRCDDSVREVHRWDKETRPSDEWNQQRRHSEDALGSPPYPRSHGHPHGMNAGRQPPHSHLFPIPSYDRRAPRGAPPGYSGEEHRNSSEGHGQFADSSSHLMNAQRSIACEHDTQQQPQPEKDVRLHITRGYNSEFDVLQHLLQLQPKGETNTTHPRPLPNYRDAEGAGHHEPQSRCPKHQQEAWGESQRMEGRNWDTYQDRDAAMMDRDPRRGMDRDAAMMDRDSRRGMDRDAAMMDRDSRRGMDRDAAMMDRDSRRGMDRDAAMMDRDPRRGMDRDAAMMDRDSRRGMDRDAAMMDRDSRRGMDRDAAMMDRDPRRGMDRDAAMMDRDPRRGMDRDAAMMDRMIDGGAVGAGRMIDRRGGNRRGGRPSGSNVMPPSSLPPDKEALEKFKRLYALQEDQNETADHLRKQASSTTGVVGTLDVSQVLDLVAAHDVTIVVTDTGTGKSTLIPKAILDDDPGAKIVNTQPRRTPAIKLAERVSVFYGEKVGSRVGYWVRGEHAGEVGQTPIMYVTNYTLFLYLLHTTPDCIGMTHVIFDEFHERSVEVEVSLLLMKLVMKRNPGRIKLILCSATAEASKWAGFFDGLTVGEYSKANAMYPVHDYYLEDVSRLIGVACVAPDIESSGIMSSIQLHTIIFYMKKLLEFLATAAKPGDSILMFVPGRTVVEQLTLWIRDNLGEELDAIPWYRDIELSYVQEAIQRKSGTKKKVYVATDIAEVSITLPDVVFVIDSGTVKRPYITESNPNSVAFPPLELMWESAVNLKQRRGRAGRVQQGFFFTMVLKEQVPQLPPCDCRLSNAVIHEIVLHCLYLTSAPYILFSMCPEKPRNVSVQLSLNTLCDGGYIVPEEDHTSLIERIDNPEHLSIKKVWSELVSEAYESRSETKQGGLEGVDSRQLATKPPANLRYHVTLRGLIVGRLPFAVNAGAVVFHGLLTGLTTLSIVAASCIACNSPFYVPYDVTDRVERLKVKNCVQETMLQFKGRLRNDVVSSVGAVLEYMQMQQEGLSEEGQNTWCEKRYLSRMRIVDILLLVQQAKDQLGALIPFEDIDDVGDLRRQYDTHAQMLSILCSAAFMQRGIFVLHDAETAQKERFAGSGVFVNINCSRDMSVPTACPWTRNTVCVPYTLHTAYDRLVGSFSSQLSQEVYNVMLLVFSSTILFEEIVDEAAPVTFEVWQCGSRVFITCDCQTALQLLQLRRLMCARLCILHMLLQREASITDVETMSDLLIANGSNFGIPCNMEARPDLIPAMITSNVIRIIEGIEEAATKVRVGGNEGSAVPHCKPREPPPGFNPTRQSALVFSSNGCAPYHRPEPIP